MKIDIKNLSLTPEAAQYMAAKMLVMRNSFTEQVESLHYQLSLIPEAFTPGGGQYCTPLWTVAIPQLLQDIENRKLELTDKINCNSWDKEYSSIPLSTLPNSKIYLENFVDKIKRSIIAHTAFGHLFKKFYDYELLIAGTPYHLMDDLGRYPTGGRCHQNFNKDTIIYRATFNEVEIGFFKSILAGDRDTSIFAMQEDIAGKQDLVIKTIRTTLCKQLAAEIISSKLIIFLNACGQLKTVIAFSSTHLNGLLEQTIQKNHTEITQLLRTDAISYVAEDSYSDYINTRKYTHTRFFNYPANNNLAVSVPQLKAAERCKKMLTPLAEKTDLCGAIETVNSASTLS